MGANLERPDDRIASVLRFAAELVAWVASPWALSKYSWLLAVLAVAVLIGLPTVFSLLPRSPHGWRGPIYAAVLVSLLVAATLVTERQRWQWLLSTDRRTG